MESSLLERVVKQHWNASALMTGLVKFMTDEFSKTDPQAHAMKLRHLSPWLIPCGSLFASKGASLARKGNESILSIT